MRTNATYMPAPQISPFSFTTPLPSPVSPLRRTTSDTSVCSFDSASDVRSVGSSKRKPSSSQGDTDDMESLKSGGSTSSDLNLKHRLLIGNKDDHSRDSVRSHSSSRKRRSAHDTLLRSPRDTIRSPRDVLGNRETSLGSASVASYSSADSRHDDEGAPTCSQDSQLVGQTQCTEFELPNGKRVQHRIVEDPGLEEFQIAQQRAARHSNISLQRVRNRYKSDADDIERIWRIECAKYRGHRREEEGEVANYIRQNRGKSMCVARSRLGPVRVDMVEDYHDSVLAAAAGDVAENIILTLVERAGFTTTGVCLCLRLCYSSFVRSTPDEEVFEHLRIAAQLAMDCFPNEHHDPDFYTLNTAGPCPRLKASNVDPEHTLPALSQSMRAVWPRIVIRDPRRLKAFWATLAIRIAAHSPFHDNVVDTSLFVKTKLMVQWRCAFAHKVIACIECDPRALNREMAEYESSCDEDDDAEEDLAFGSVAQQTVSSFQQKNSKARSRSSKQNATLPPLQRRTSSLQRFCDCLSSKRLVPLCDTPHAEVRSTMQGDMFLNRSNNHSTSADELRNKWKVDTSAIECLNLHQQLQCMSVIPVHDVRSCRRWTAPPDVPQDIENEPVYIPEVREQKQRLKTAGAEAVHPQKDPDLYALCTKVIRLVNPELYEHLVARSITKLRDSICVDVRGHNQNFCLLHGGLHNYDCHIYFMIMPLTYRVEARCYFGACKDLITMRKKIAEFEKRQAQRKQTLSASGGTTSDAVEPEPPGVLTEAQKEAFASMEAVIELETMWRDPLCRALGKSYTGMRRPTTMLVPECDMKQLVSPGARPGSDEDLVFSEKWGMAFPRWLDENDPEAVKAHIKSHPCREIRKKNTEFHLAYVEAIDTKTMELFTNTTALSQRELKALYQAECETDDVFLLPP